MCFASAVLFDGGILEVTTTQEVGIGLEELANSELSNADFPLPVFGLPEGFFFILIPVGFVLSVIFFFAVANLFCCLESTLFPINLKCTLSLSPLETVALAGRLCHLNDP